MSRISQTLEMALRIFHFKRSTGFVCNGRQRRSFHWIVFRCFSSDRFFSKYRGHTILSPTLVVGKGFGPWDLQSTIGGSLAASGSNMLGRSIVFNTALDYRIKGKLWPTIEQNSTFWYGGLLDGKRQTFITPGVVLGAFPIEKRLHFSVGVGYQIAATSFRQYNHRWILSLRFPF
jgi:hypothetical protein